MELVVLAAVAAVVWRLLRGRSPVRTGPSEVGPVGWCPGTVWRVARPLARADGARVLRHPAFIVGVALTPLMLLAATGQEHAWHAIGPSIALALVPMAWSTIIAVDLVALRPRRTGADELLAALPAPQPVRTTALLAAGLGPVLVATAVSAAWVAVVETRGDDVTGTPVWSEVGAGILIVAGAVGLGVATARWLPRAIVGVAVAIATAFIQARFLDVTTWPWDGRESDLVRFLGFIASGTSAGDPVLEVRPAGWHLVYLAGLVAIAGAVALARDGIRRPVATLLAIAIVVSAGAGWMQTRPPTAETEARMVSYLTQPADHHVCETTGDVRYCAYPGFADQIARWRGPVEATLAVLPRAARGTRPPLQVIQRPATIVGNSGCSPIPFDAALPAGVAARITPAALWPADHDVHPGFSEDSFGCSDHDGNGFFLAVQVGAWATGLPPAPHDLDERCTATGQARSVIALWAAAAARADGAATLRRTVVEGSVAGGSLISFPGWDAPPMWGVQYAVSDAELALELLERPARDVAETLGARWARWTDPAASSAELADALDVRDAALAEAGRGAASPCS